jgi:hypothetical protein
MIEVRERERERERENGTIQKAFECSSAGSTVQNGPTHIQTKIDSSKVMNKFSQKPHELTTSTHPDTTISGCHSLPRMPVRQTFTQSTGVP